MPNYVKEYISIEEFLILQQWKVPYTGFIKGVGYTYPQYDAVEFPLDWSIPNWTFGNEGGNLAASKIRNLECPSYKICLIDYGCGKFNRKIHIMEQYP